MTEENRPTKEREGKHRRFPVKDGEEIYAGVMVQIDSDGKAEMATDEEKKTVVGIAEEYVNNRNGGESVEVKKGCFCVNNDSENPITHRQTGQPCFIKDNDTVCRASGTGHFNKAGTVFEVTLDGVWVII